MSLAYMSSLERIFLALTNICFSPVERPFSWSRSARLRTTSASSKMSPVFILSRLCLKRRFQFFGMFVPLPVSAFSTLDTICSSITLRRPTRSALSLGTFTVMSSCRILMVRYSRFSPSTVRVSRLTTVPAPWWGYTTLSPTLYNADPPLRRSFSTTTPATTMLRRRLGQYSENRWKTPTFRPRSRKSPACSVELELQVAVDQVVLLQPAQALPDLACAHRPDALDRLELALRGARDRLEARQARDEALDDRVGQARNVREHAIAARRDTVVEWVDRRGITEHGEQLELEQLVVRQARERFEALPRALGAAVGVVVVDERGLLVRDVGHELLELKPDQPALLAQLDTGPLDLVRHPRRQLGALQRDQHVVEHDRPLELQRGQASYDLFEPGAVGLERAERLVRLREHVGDRVELVAALADEDSHRLALLRDRDHQRVGLPGDALGGAMARPGLRRGNRRIRHQLHVRVRQLRHRRVDDDRAVHLRQLVEELRGERLIELDPAGEHERELRWLADHDQGALARADDVVDPLPKVGAGGDAGDRGQELGVEPRIGLVWLANETERGRDPRGPIFLRLVLHRSLPSPPA